MTYFLKKMTYFTYAVIFVISTMILGFMPKTILAQPIDKEEPVSSPQKPKSLKAVKEYWTEDKMKNAKPIPLPTLPGKLKPKAGTTPWIYTSYQLLPDSIELYKQAWYRSVGKLFFTIPGEGNFVCSASIVQAPNQDLVWTAGHCIYSPDLGVWHENVLFVPARHEFTNPFESFTARNLMSTSGWINLGLFEYDMGAVILNTGGPGGTHHIQEAGGFTFLANLPRQQHFHVKGYPSAPPFDGEHHHTCAAGYAASDQPTGIVGVDPATIGVGCDMTGGSSGGPWIVDWGTNFYLNGNVSYGYEGFPDELYGPYFGNAAQNLYDIASID